MSGKRKKAPKVDERTALFCKLKAERMRLTGLSYITVIEHVRLWDAVDRHMAQNQRSAAPRSPRTTP